MTYRKNRKDGVQFREDGCWEWIGVRNAQGYGRIYLGGDPRYRMAHRVFYTLANGAIPDGLVIDHLCRNRACVNPDHMEPVTSGENVLRGVGVAPTNAAKTECPQGHAYDARNTYIKPSGARVCRTCRVIQKRLRRAGKAALR